MNEADVARIERACAKLVVRYTHLVDFGEASRIAELFAEDGIWEVGGAGELPGGAGRFEGREALRAMFQGRQEMAQRRSRHVCTNLDIEVEDEAHASGVVYLQLYRHDFETAVPEATLAPAAAPVAVGQYRDRFVRTDEGWRFALRRAELAFGTL